MNPRALQRLSPEFASVRAECRYRLRHLDDTIRHARLVACIGGTANLLLLVSDYLFWKFGSALFVLLAVRLSASGLGFWLAFALRRRRSPRWLDGGMFAWMLSMLVVTVVASLMRPPSFLLHVLVAQTVVFAGYLFVPMRYGHRLVCGIGGAIGYLLMLALTRPLSFRDFVPLVLAMLIANLIGSAAAFRLERLRRWEFVRFEEGRYANWRLAREIRERQQLAAAVEEREQALDRIFTVTPMPMALWKREDGTLLRANPAFAELVQAGTVAPHIPQNIDFHIGPARRKLLLRALDAKGQVNDVEVQNIAADGAPRWFALSVRALEYRSAPSLLCCWYDVSARKAEKRALIQAKLAAEQTGRIKSQFLAMVSHEIRTPMNGVVGSLQLLADEGLNDAQRKHICMAQDSADALVSLLDTILDYARFESGQQILDTQDFDLHQLIESCLGTMHARADDKGLALDAVVKAPRPVMLRGDVVRLRQVLLNLLSNAIKFTAENGVSVRADLGPPIDDGRIELRIAVTDSGIGIAPAAHTRIFEEFVQADAGIARQFGGAGLGLAICRQIVSLMGGEITLTSIVGRGSTFAIRVPLQAGDLPTTPTSMEYVVEKCLRVLLVEDDAVNSEVATGLLRQLGHEAVIAASGGAALTIAACTRFDAVFMDLHLPGMDGIEAAKHLRAHFTAQGLAVPILGLTADVTEDTRLRCREAGIVAIVSKPVTRARLQAALRGAMMSPATLVEDRRPVADTPPGLIDMAFLAAQWRELGTPRMTQVLRLFRRTSDELVAALEHAAATRSLPMIVKLAHRLCSAAGSIGLAGLHDLAAQIEQANAADIDRLVPRLRSISRATQRALVAARKRLSRREAAIAIDNSDASRLPPRNIEVEFVADSVHRSDDGGARRAN